MVKLPVQIPLQKKIYVKASFLRDTLGAKKATHVCRRLIKGIFKDEAIKTCTLRGQAPRNCRNEDRKTNSGILHRTAIRAIIGEF